MMLAIEIIGIIIITGLLITCVCTLINDEKRYQQITKKIDLYFEDSI